MDSQELATKRERLQQLMQAKGVQAIWISKNANLAWISGGNRTYIETTSEQGIAGILVTAERATVLTNNIEGDRLAAEEGFGDWEVIAEPWHAPGQRLAQLTAGLRVATDDPALPWLPVGADLVRLRAPLTPAEIARYRDLGRDAGAAMARAARALEPGMREHDAAALVAQECYRIDAIPAVVLVSSDARFHTVRHPLPTAQPIQQVAMLVVCARRHGLIANLTRIVHFGPPSAEFRERNAAVACIAGATIAATRPGAPIAAVFARIEQAYAEAGFPGGWQAHHQGGACSYGTRDYVATPTSAEIVTAPQAFAWNPSLPGAKSEDTVLITEAGAEVLTASPDWPLMPVQAGDQTLGLAGVLER